MIVCFVFGTGLTLDGAPMKVTLAGQVGGWVGGVLDIV
jgi:hypothetical protein